MSLTPVGFAGSVNAVLDARRSQFQGVQVPIVAAYDAMQVAVNTSASLACTISPGVAWAHGVQVASDQQASAAFDAVTVAGQTRWDAVVLRRTWTIDGGTVGFLVVKGTAAAPAQPVEPAGVNTSIGTTHDQVLALVQLTYGQSLPTAVIDKRLWASKVITARTYAALPAPSLALYGMAAELVDGSRYRCLLDQSSNPAWVGVSSAVTELVGTQAMSIASGWDTATSLLVRGLKEGRVITVDITLRWTSTTPLNCATADGNFDDTALGQLVPALRPDVEKPLFVHYVANAASPRVLGGTATISPNGVVTLLSGVPGQDLIRRTGDLYSIRGSSTYQRKVA